MLRNGAWFWVIFLMILPYLSHCYAADSTLFSIHDQFQQGKNDAYVKNTPTQNPPLLTTILPPKKPSFVKHKGHLTEMLSQNFAADGYYKGGAFFCGLAYRMP